MPPCCVSPKRIVDRRAFEIVLQDEVDDAADRVRAVHGRRAARDRLDALDRGRRNRVHVDDHRALTGMPAAVDQHQVAVRAEAAQVDSADADRAVGPACIAGVNCVPSGTNCGIWFSTVSMLITLV